MTACSEIAIRNTNDHFWHLCRSDDVLRSHGYGDPAARGERIGACFPDYRTGLSIQGHQVRVGLPQENQSLAINHSPISVGGHRGRWDVMPDLLAGFGVNPNTPLLLPLTYITPSTTIGVASFDTASVASPVKFHATFSWETLEGLIRSMSAYR